MDVNENGRKMIKFKRIATFYRLYMSGLFFIDFLWVKYIFDV